MDEDVQRFWDEQAATFDEEPDHGLSETRDPAGHGATSCGA